MSFPKAPWWPPPPHSGPGCGRINLWKCTKNQAKPGNSSLNIAFHKTGMIFNESLKKNDFWPFLHFWLCQGLNGHFGLLGTKNNRPSSQRATCRKTEGVQSYVSMLGRYTPIELGLSEPKKWGLYGCSVKNADFGQFWGVDFECLLRLKYEFAWVSP